MSLQELELAKKKEERKGSQGITPRGFTWWLCYSNFFQTFTESLIPMPSGKSKQNDENLPEHVMKLADPEF